MLRWIIGAVIGATLAAITFQKAEERKKAEIAKEDEDIEKNC